MCKRFFSSLVLVATVALYGCGGGGGGGGSLDQLVSIAVTPATPSITTGATQQFTATGTYTVSSPKDLTASVTWSSSDTSIATISASGMVLAKAAGTTIITATQSGVPPTSVTLTVTLPLIINTIAGSSGLPGYVNDTGTAARFDLPNGVTTDGTNLYVADTFNHAIRQITPAGVVTLVADLAVSTGPIGITINGTDLYVAESLGNTVRKITTAGVVTTIGTAGQFNQPMGIATDGTFLYIADYRSHSILKMDLSGTVTTLASVANPIAITIFGNDLYVADDASAIIIKIDKATGAQTLVAGSAFTPGTADGTGAAARFKSPTGITTDGTNLYVIDNQNSSIRKIVIASSKVTTVTSTLKDSNTLKSFGALGITMFGTSLCTTNNDDTITLFSGGIIN